MKNKSFLKGVSCLLTQVLLISLLIYFPSCSDGDTILDTGGNIGVPDNVLRFGSASLSKSVEIEFDDKQGEVDIAIASNGTEWTTAKLEGKTLTVVVKDNLQDKDRQTLLIVAGQGKRETILVKQNKAHLSPDIRVIPTSATATSFEEEYKIENTWDDSFKTYFNSKFGKITEWPFEIIYNFEDVEVMDYLVYFPRQDNGNRWGAFGKFEVFVSSESSPEFKQVGGMYDAYESTISPFRVKFDTPIEKPKAVKFLVHSALESRVSISEMGFYVEKKEDPYNALTIFKDWSCSELLDGITEKEINRIPDLAFKNMALDLLNKTYDPEFRVQTYRPYMNPVVTAAINKSGVYGIRDNATGIYVDDITKPLYVFVADTKGQNLAVIVQDVLGGFNNEVFSISQGINVINPKTQGLLYINNQSNEDLKLEPKTEAQKKAIADKTVKINIRGGAVNGYFDISKHTIEDWDRIIKNAKHTEFDVLGRYIHLLWITEHFQAPGMSNIFDVMKNWDTLVELEETFTGQAMYDKRNVTRACFIIDRSAPAAYAGDYRTAYNASYGELFTNVDKFATRMWGPAHEVGHINQVRPDFKWGGTTEVTNNLQALYVQQEMGLPMKLLIDGEYAKARAEIIDKQQPHCLINGGNQFMMKVVPFWQLQLYIANAKGQEHFYKHIHEHYRITANLEGASDQIDGLRQLNFVRQVCKEAKMDLTDFFIKWGFLRAADVAFDDYGAKTMKISQNQVDALIAEIKAMGYPEPIMDVTTIQDDNVDLFK